MELKGVTLEMVEKARRESAVGAEVDAVAIVEVTAAMHEHCVALLDEHDDPERSWNQMNQAQRQSGLEVGAWIIHRLALAGFKVVKA